MVKGSGGYGPSPRDLSLSSSADFMLRGTAAGGCSCGTLNEEDRRGVPFGKNVRSDVPEAPATRPVVHPFPSAIRTHSGGVPDSASAAGLEVGTRVQLAEWKALEGSSLFHCNKRNGNGRNFVLVVWPRWLVELELPEAAKKRADAPDENERADSIIRESLALSGLSQIHVPPSEPGIIELRFGVGSLPIVYLMSNAKVRSLGRILQQNLTEEMQIARTATTDHTQKQAGEQARSRKLVAFDFDNTIAQKQVWSVPDTDVVAKLIGEHRSELLRVLFRCLQSRGVVQIVVSFNKRAVIEATLRDLGVLDCFLAIHDGNDVKEGLFATQGAKTKGDLMRALLRKHSLDGPDALLVDDDMSNLRGCPCSIVHVATKRGIGPSEVREILAKLDTR